MKKIRSGKLFGYFRRFQAKNSDIKWHSHLWHLGPTFSDFSAKATMKNHENHEKEVFAQNLFYFLEYKTSEHLKFSWYGNECYLRRFATFHFISQFWTILPQSSGRSWRHPVPGGKGKSNCHQNNRNKRENFGQNSKHFSHFLKLLILKFKNSDKF